MTVRRWLDRVGFLGTSGGVLATGFLNGLGVLSFRIELVFAVVIVVLLQAVLSSLVFSLFLGGSGAVFVAKLLRDRRADEAATDAGRVVAVVPVYRDAEVLHRSVRSLLDSEYRNLAIRIVTEPDDDPTRRRAAELAAHDDVEVLVNRGPASKAGAINHAVAATDGEYVAVFDADERVDPSFVGHAVARLADCDVVQGRTIPEPTGVIESLAYYESVLLSYVSRRLLYLVSDFRMASSRAVVMRRSAFEAVDGYDPEMLTEDFEFAYRCYRNGLAVRETLAHPSRIEAAHSLRDWWGQRKRWMTGYVQVFERLLAGVDPRAYRSILSPLVCGGSVVGSGLLVALLSKFAVLLFVGVPFWVLPPLAVVFALALGVRIHDARTAGVGAPSVWWLLTPAVLPLYGFTTIKAMFEYALTWDGGWYAVERTDTR